MISGCTLNTPTPIPLTNPTATPTRSPATIDRVTPNGAWLAMMYAAAVATFATERSIPPVMTTRVWPAARIPRGAANSRMFDTQCALTAPGRMISISPASATSSAIRTRNDRCCTRRTTDTARVLMLSSAKRRLRRS